MLRTHPQDAANQVQVLPNTQVIEVGVTYVNVCSMVYIQGGEKIISSIKL